MKILFDHQIFQYQNHGGISRYFCDLIPELNKITGVETKNSVLYSNNAHYNQMMVQKIPDGWVSKKRMNYHYRHETNEKESIRLLKESNYDIFHPTYYNPYFLDFVEKYVIDVHDMIYEKFPEYYGLDTEVIENKNKTLRKASYILSNSQSAKKDIMEIYSIPGDNIVVVGRGDSFSPTYNEMLKKNIRFKVPGKFILYVGSRGLYKNFHFFAQSIASILIDRDMYLIAVGGGKFSEMENRYLNVYGLGNRVMQMTVDDITLAHLYSRAEMMVLPSLYEGFGLPILEAFACKCPVIASNTSSMPEVAGSAALYFDPKNGGDIQDRIETLINEPEIRERLIERGNNRITEFSWNKVAKSAYHVYSRMVN